jgi:hypothetical protein
MEPVSGVELHDVLAAEAYWSVQPVRLTDELPRLKSST